MANRKVTQEIFSQIKQSLSSGEGIYVLADRYHISPTTVENIKSPASYERYLANRGNKLLRETTEPTRVAGGNAMITEDEFTKIKELLFRGEAIYDIAQITGRSRVSVRIIDTTTTFVDYRAAILKYGRGEIHFKKRLLVPYAETGEEQLASKKDIHNDDPYIRAGEQFAELLRTIMVILKTK